MTIVALYAAPDMVPDIQAGVTYVPPDVCANPVGAWVVAYDFTFVSDLAIACDGSIYATGDTNGPDGSLDIIVWKLHPDGSQAWSQTFGGRGWDGGNGIAVGPDGSVWVTGFFELSVDFDPGDGVDERTSLGGWDAFVTRFAIDGNYLGTLILASGAGNAFARGIRIDAAGNAFIVGGFSGSADFDPTDGLDMRTASPKGYDVFVTKLASDGSYLWTRTFGGPVFYDIADTVRVDKEGNVFVYGHFRGTIDFDPGEGQDFHTGTIPDTLFVTKLDGDGFYKWTRVLQVQLSEVYDPIEVDAKEDIWIVGGFRNFLGAVDFDPTPEGTDERFTQGPNDVFVSKWHNDGSYAWTGTFTGSGVAYGVAPDSDGGVVVTGLFTGTMDFDPGPGVQQRTADLSGNVFITKLDGAGSWVWTRTIDGPNNEYGHFLTFAADGGLIVAGLFAGTVDFDPGCAVDEQVSNSYDGYIAKLGCVPPTADANSDGVVNLLDLAAFQVCFSGLAPTTCNPGCYPFDFDSDDDIDLSDFAEFQRALTRGTD